MIFTMEQAVRQLEERGITHALPSSTGATKFDTVELKKSKDYDAMVGDAE